MVAASAVSAAAGIVVAIAVRAISGAGTLDGRASPLIMRSICLGKK